MRYRILDLETIGLPQAVEWVDPLKAPSNYKDPLKIDAFIKEAEAERAEKFGLDADTCQIVALGWHDVGYGDPTVLIFKDEDQERAGLRVFWDTYQQQYTKLVTYNGTGFDLPVLIMRSIYLDVDYPEIVIRPEWKTPHIDIYEKLSVQGARKNVKSLKFYAKRLGIGTLDKVDGSQISQLVAEGKWDDVESHCLSDIGLTHALANRLKLLRMAPVGNLQDAVI
jgi:predicted PolB exonuclease-like 3'-5' exonuclease